MAYWVFDVDGTLALMDGRSPFDWSRVGEDTPNPPAVEMANALWRAGHMIVVVSGRMDSCRAETEEWLDRYGVQYNSLFMRATGDVRKDSEVKAELLGQIIRHYLLVGDPATNIRVVDDRRQCVDMWRRLGLFCAQVAPGEF
jgi:hypothetical protein